ncbi:MAG: tRNA threonylcarbamoyladenosine dehydratase [Lachnospiraceae bacterium]|nr:tRNA threonylcarbamoyladenosine dehydratase [Lachnospiraceae bacterium]
MSGPFSRTERLIGAEALQKLQRSRVAVFGIGGVGGYAVEALARSGIGALDLVDSDRVALSNLNRQILATHATVGMRKVDAARERIAQINPDCIVRCYPVFFLPETKADFDFSAYDYIVDAVDTVSAKLALVMAAEEAGVPIISAMGAGNKMDAAAFTVADIYETSVCPLARIMRKLCREHGIKSLKVVYSREEVKEPEARPEDAEELAGTGRRAIPGSNAFVPGTAGLILAGEVVKDLIGERSAAWKKE